MKDLMLNLHDMILVLGAVEAIFVAIALRLIPSPRQQARSLLAILFVLLGGTLFGNLLLWSPGFSTSGIRSTLFLPLAFSMCVLLQGPALYLYFCALSRPLDIRKPLYLLHLLPLFITFMVILWFDIDAEHFVPSPELEGLRAYILWTAMKCAPLAYVIAAMVIEVRIRRQAKDIYSSLPALDNHLAAIVLIGFFAYWLFSCIGHFISPYLDYPVQDALGILNNYLGVALVNALLVFGFLNARQVVSISASKPTTTLSEDKNQSIIDNIEAAIHERKIYLESDINLEKFSREIGSNAKHVSYVINNHYRSNFFEFINQFRIEEAKRLLRAEECKDKTILDIVYLSGFNSQSAFHRFFKRLVDMTPSEYRNLKD